MTNLRKLLAFNLKKHRHRYGISQAKLAEKAGASTQYIAMIELERKFPSVEMIEKIATALEIDCLELFIPLPVTQENLKDFQNIVTSDLEKALTRSINKVVREIVSSVVNSHSKKIENKKLGTAKR
jgi:transcriptional regulator with XRE-family HTH domain